ncbi:hypothetical protein D3C73_1094020 [compost metagenome]
MPELVNSRVGSLPGTSGADGTMVWPLPLKNSRKSLRIWDVVNLADAFMGAGSLRAGARAAGRSGQGRTDRRNPKGYQARRHQSQSSGS